MSKTTECVNENHEKIVRVNNEKLILLCTTWI